MGRLPPQSFQQQVWLHLFWSFSEGFVVSTAEMLFIGEGVDGKSVELLGTFSSVKDTVCPSVWVPVPLPRTHRTLAFLLNPEAAAPPLSMEEAEASTMLWVVEASAALVLCLPHSCFAHSEHPPVMLVSK